MWSINGNDAMDELSGFGRHYLGVAHNRAECGFGADIELYFPIESS